MNGEVGSSEEVDGDSGTGGEDSGRATPTEGTTERKRDARMSRGSYMCTDILTCIPAKALYICSLSDETGSRRELKPRSGRAPSPPSKTVDIPSSFPEEYLPGSRGQLPPEGSLSRSLPQPEESISRSLPQPEESISRSLPQPEESISRSLPQPEESLSRSLPQPEESISHSLPQPEESISRSLPQPEESLSRSLPQPEESLSRSLPQPEESLSRSLPPPVAEKPKRKTGTLRFLLRIVTMATDIRCFYFKSCHVYFTV